MSDRIAVMNRGVIEQVDAPEAVYERPRTTFVAGFIGVSNLMPGTVSSANGRGAELKLDSGVTVTAPTNGLAAGEPVHAVVRPEKLQIARADEPGSGERPNVEGQVESSLYLGTSTQFVVRLPDGVGMTVLVPNADESERQRLPNAGDRVRLSWANEHMHVVREAEARAPDPDQELERARSETQPAAPA
jgi:spermidine/putrescine transport system ATP-binding protein